MTASQFDHYLATYAEPQASVYAERVVKNYSHVIVVPMYDEDPHCLGDITRHHRRSNALVVVVVNAPADAAPGPLARTQALLRDAASTSMLDVLTVDCVSAGLTLKPACGVGLARKIGTDIALQLFAQGKIDSPWLYQTDADAELPVDYFSTRLPAAGAVVFAHTYRSNDAQLAQAVDLYDKHMRYYVAGLASAGSSYAYPTLGSTLAVHANAYCAVRGYPKRNAAEDFYLLNKVAKVACVSCYTNPQLVLRARLSTRVPFGTGPALEKICAGLQVDPSGSFYMSYHPASFTLLAQALSYLDEFAQNLCAPPVKIEPLLATLGFHRVRDNIATKYSTPTRRRQVLRQWFDAGKTLRFIHATRRYHADQSLLKTLKEQP